MEFFLGGGRRKGIFFVGGRTRRAFFQWSRTGRGKKPEGQRRERGGGSSGLFSTRTRSFFSGSPPEVFRGRRSLGGKGDLIGWGRGVGWGKSLRSGGQLRAFNFGQREGFFFGKPDHWRAEREDGGRTGRGKDHERRVFGGSGMRGKNKRNRENGGRGEEGEKKFIIKLNYKFNKCALP